MPAKIKINSYKDLIVWQKSMDLVVMVYEITSQFPQTEIYSLTSQMRRCAISIPSNIAEGRYRGTRKDFLRFIRIAFGSGAELETQVEIAKRLPIGRKINFSRLDDALSQIMRMLNKMILSLKKPKTYKLTS